MTIYEMVKADLDARERVGKEHYGDTFTMDSTPGDTGVWLEELYAELLDACAYLRGELEKRRKEHGVAANGRA